MGWTIDHVAIITEKEWEVTHDNRDEALLKWKGGFIYAFASGYIKKIIREFIIEFYRIRIKGSIVVVDKSNTRKIYMSMGFIVE